MVKPPNCGRKEKFVKQAEQGAVDWDALRRQHEYNSCLERGDAELVTRLDCCSWAIFLYKYLCGLLYEWF